MGGARAISTSLQLLLLQLRPAGVLDILLQVKHIDLERFNPFMSTKFFKFSQLLGDRLCTASFKSLHKCSMVLRCGLWLGPLHDLDAVVGKLF